MRLPPVRAGDDRLRGRGVLIETGAYKDYPRIILVTLLSEQQIETRHGLRDGLTREEVKLGARLSRQLPPEAKRQFARTT